MITDSFDNKSEAKINPKFNEDAYKLDVCILTFSNVIEEYVLNNYKCEKIGEIKDAADTRFIYKIDYKGKKIGFFKTYVGAPSCVGSIETSSDAFYRETLNNFEKRKTDGCISVEMECSAVQAMCDFRNLEFYTFFTSGDLLDSPKWDERHKKGELEGTQHDSTHFDIAIELANYVSEL